jgi:hypothetical protein
LKSPPGWRFALPRTFSLTTRFFIFSPASKFHWQYSSLRRKEIQIGQFIDAARQLVFRVSIFKHFFSFPQEHLL